MNVPSERSATAHQPSAEPDVGPEESSTAQWTARSSGLRIARRASEAQWVGRELDGRYRILCLLGERWMGATFLALHLPLQKLVAIKVVPAELIGNGEAVIDQTRAVIANPRFEHPHVARANDCATLPEGGAYFVMQLVRGDGLGGLLAKGEPLPWGTACELGAQIADALAAAEGAGVVHRDLNPDNILLEEREDGSDFVKILDFGIAQAVPAEPASMYGSETVRTGTWARTVIGTPGYMAPEQAIGSTADHRCDLYALGVILWESIAGKTLWTGPDVAALLFRQMSETAPALGRVAPDATRPPELDRLIQSLLERDPASRPAHAADVCDMLRLIADHAAFPLSDDPSWQRERARRRRTLSRGLGLLALGCLAMLAFFAYRWSTEERRAAASRPAPTSKLGPTPSPEPAALAPMPQVAHVAAVPTQEVAAPASLPPRATPPVSDPPRNAPVADTRDAAAKPTARPRGTVPAAAAAPRPASKQVPRGGQGGLLQPVGGDPSLIAPAPTEARTPEEPKPKSQPSAQIQELSVRGAIATSMVRRAIERIHPRVTACYAPYAGVLAEPTELDIDVAFDERGRARDPQARGASSSALRACVAAAAASLVLARAPDTGLAKASWRVSFSSQ